MSLRAFQSRSSSNILLFFRSIRNIKGSEYTCIIAVVKKNWAEKEEAGVLSLLRVGFNRVSCLQFLTIINCFLFEYKNYFLLLLRFSGF
jgi:hypothetical protein